MNGYTFAMTRGNRIHVDAAACVLAVASVSAIALYAPRIHAEPDVPAAPATYAPASMPVELPPVVDAPVTDLTATPILLLVEDVDPAWGVFEAVDTWNRLIGCEAIVTTVDQDWHDTYRVVEVPDLTFEGTPVAGAFNGQDEIALDPADVDTVGVALHEIGHALGLQHTHEMTGVMSDRYDVDRSQPSPSEVALARTLNEGRCQK